MLALEFPPVNSTGAFRYLKFIKHLYNFGIKVTIIAPPADDLIQIHPYSKVDDTLLKGLPADIDIIRVPLSEKAQYTIKEVTFKSKIRHYLNFKGDNLADSWHISLFNCVEKLVSTNRPDCIFVSLPPYSLGPLAAKIAGKFSIPLVADFRDEWSLNKSVPFPTILHYWYAKKMERFIFDYANKVTIVTPQLIQLFRKIHKQTFENKFELLTNGFDFDEVDFAKFSNKIASSGEKFIIGYSGSFYYDPRSSALSEKPFYKRPGIKKITYRQSVTREDWSYRSPLYFIKALAFLFSRRPDLKNIIFFHHIGHLAPWLVNMISEFELQNNFVSHGFLSKQENLLMQNNFNALLCTSEKVIDGEHYCLSSKVFDYIKMRKPILAFVTNGITKSFIEKCGCGIICDPDNFEESSFAIEKLVTQSMQFYPDKDYLDQFLPDNLSKKLAFVIKEIV